MNLRRLMMQNCPSRTKPTRGQSCASQKKFAADGRDGSVATDAVGLTYQLMSASLPESDRGTALSRNVVMGQEPTSSSGLVNDVKDCRELTLWLRSSSGPSVRSSRSVGDLPLIYGVMDRLGHDPAILDQKRVSAVAHGGMLGLRRPLQKGDAPLYETVRIDVRCSGQLLLQ